MHNYRKRIYIYILSRVKNNNSNNLKSFNIASGKIRAINSSPDLKDSSL